MDLGTKLGMLGSRNRSPQQGRTDAAGFLPAGFPGKRQETPLGPVFYLEEVLPANLNHGNRPLASFLKTEAGLLFRLCGRSGAPAQPNRQPLPSEISQVVDEIAVAEEPPFGDNEEDLSPRHQAGEGFSPESILFLDTETTGLAGGTGTYVFLVGLGYFVGDSFVLRQYFLPDYHLEPPLLVAVAQEMRRFPYLLSFNGKVFDWPLLVTRFQLNRLTPELPEPGHLDFLFPARRLWRESLGSCSLSNLETVLLAVQREGDVPGELIPSLYFDFLRHKDFSVIAPVFAHNRSDLLSLVTLASRAVEQFHRPADQLTAEENLARGRFYEALGEKDKAILAYEKVLWPSAGSPRLSPNLRQRSAERLSLLYKEMGRHQEATRLWHQMVDSGTLSLLPYVELAKYYEHKAKDPLRARSLVLAALEMARRRHGLRGDQFTPREKEELRHRLNRLEEKIRRQ
ncbi:MAG: ribonuclease H-like domain-containing protein [Firmicutes bacterium]|nr:ribonuclease H-like domain-containing protein [Bacillota bacterium]MCL5038861.1 ribonuclease H-like domain-containing protein [Bacillota bacterium]